MGTQPCLATGSNLVAVGRLHDVIEPILIWQSLRKRVAPPGFIALLLVGHFY